MTSIYPKNSDHAANTFTLKFIGFTCIIFFIIWLLNTLDIFIVDKSIMNSCFWGSFCINIATFSITKLFGIGNKRTKYIVLFFATLNCAFTCTMLSYHAILFSLFPVLLAIQYRNKNVLLYTIILVATGHAVSVYGSYYIGLCNANMLLFTAKPTQYYLEQIVNGTLVPFDPGLPNDIAIFIFFIVPQWFVLMGLIPILFHITKQIESRVESDIVQGNFGEIDYMTGLKNRRYYDQLAEQYYPNVERIAIITWNINNLKQTNETRGHEYGDILITMMSDSIKKLAAANNRSYRCSGDDFRLIVDNPSHGEINKLLLKWNAWIDDVNQKTAVKLNASMGYAEGPGKELGQLVCESKRLMYNFKKTGQMEAIPR